MGMDWSNGLPVSDEMPAHPRPPVTTGMRMTHIAGTLTRLDGTALLYVSEKGTAQVMMTSLDKRAKTALLAALLADAVASGVTDSTVPVDDVLFHLDMILAGQHAETYTPW